MYKLQSANYEYLVCLNGWLYSPIYSIQFLLGQAHFFDDYQLPIYNTVHIITCMYMYMYLYHKLQVNTET